MRPLSPEGQQAVADIAERHAFSPEAVTTMLHAVAAGGGGMAQFSHPEFGGSGQWMRGGMTMIGDMFNNYLKGRVVGLCEELALIVDRPGAFQPPHQQAGLFMPGTGGNWWPASLGWASSTGTQNDVRYAYFADSHRLAIDAGGRVTIYDTLDHQIGGFGQQQGFGGSLTFSSQFGPVEIGALPIVAGDAPPQPAAPPPPTGDVFATIEKLADLHAKGILSDAEFVAKKAELLSRL